MWEHTILRFRELCEIKRGLGFTICIGWAAQAGYFSYGNQSACTACPAGFACPTTSVRPPQPRPQPDSWNWGLCRVRVLGLKYGKRTHFAACFSPTIKDSRATSDRVGGGSRARSSRRAPRAPTRWARSRSARSARRGCTAPAPTATPSRAPWAPTRCPAHTTARTASRATSAGTPRCGP